MDLEQRVHVERCDEATMLYGGANGVWGGTVYSCEEMWGLHADACI